MNAFVSSAFDVHVRGIVQGVGFRPFIYRLAKKHGLTGWVLNDESGVRIHVEGSNHELSEFLKAIANEAPPAAIIQNTQSFETSVTGCAEFEIVESHHGRSASTHISPDLSTCEDCVRDLTIAGGRYHSYPYVNCTNCGPRYSIINNLPYDRAETTMAEWKMCGDCRVSYDNPLDRRFHAQPVACAQCGPRYYLVSSDCQDLKKFDSTASSGQGAIQAATKLLLQGKILAVKGIGGYHLACDGSNRQAVDRLRERKYRKDKPFAVMVKDLHSARELVDLNATEEVLLTSAAHPIVLAPSTAEWLRDSSIAPDNGKIGVMLPSTPLHHLLFQSGAPPVMVFTSANRSNEPIAYTDQDAFEQLHEIADAFLVGERPIARRIDDSVVGSSAFGSVMYRRARGYAPGAVAALPEARPLLAVGADLKNAITLVVAGQAFVSQYIGDLEHVSCFQALRATIFDLTRMYGVSLDETIVAHDAHPGYFSTQHALQLNSHRTISVQHHRAHIASVLAERSAFDDRVLGIALDGTGYGDDQAVWGGELFVGSLSGGFTRVAHLLYASLPGGDAAAKYPPQAAAGFLESIDAPDMTMAPFYFSNRYSMAQEMVRKKINSWATSSMGRLFDTAAALCGFNREITFEAQAATWLEFRARQSFGQVRDSQLTTGDNRYQFSFANDCLDWRPVLLGIIEDRRRGQSVDDIALHFHLALAQALVSVSLALCEEHGLDKVVFSGGVMQNQLLLQLLGHGFDRTTLTVWTNSLVPANDGGISLGQAALACFADTAI